MLPVHSIPMELGYFSLLLRIVFKSVGVEATHKRVYLLPRMRLS